jgi:hypothetical protein
MPRILSSLSDTLIHANKVASPTVASTLFDQMKGQLKAKRGANKVNYMHIQYAYRHITSYNHIMYSFKY